MHLLNAKLSLCHAINTLKQYRKLQAYFWNFILCTNLILFACVCVCVFEHKMFGSFFFLYPPNVWRKKAVRATFGFSKKENQCTEFIFIVQYDLVGMVCVFDLFSGNNKCDQY